MTCSECRAPLPPDADFCPGCGSRQRVPCRSCQTANRPGDRFCKRCGLPLEGAAVPAAGSGARSAREAERRQITVLFCDLVGSTRLSERLDPEELREMVLAYQAACAAIVERFEGHIAQYLGDGILVYFGYPEAHEDDAERAVRAGLRIAGEMASRSRHAGSPGPEVRIGVHTGLVVIGEVGAGSRLEHLALGETPNLAARLQELAPSGTIVISGATHRLVGDLFTYRDLGRLPVKGASLPIAVYQVLGEAEARPPFRGAGLTPLVGREEEARLLLHRWQQALDGLGQAVILIGEAGIGKSRLAQMVKEQTGGEARWVLECRCSAHYRNSPLYPIVDLLVRVLGWGRNDAAEDRRVALEGLLGRYPATGPQAVPLLASLLSLPPSEAIPPLGMSPERQRQRTEETLLALLLAMAAERPVLLIGEDLHWADPSTLELLARLLDQVPAARLLVLLTVRPPFDAPWGPRTHLTQLTLDRLSRRHTELMVERVAGPRALPAAVVREVVTKTDGVPLFVEEFTKMVIESGLLSEREDGYALDGPLPALAIPSTLHDSLTARLDRLATVKDVAQLAATLGRAFPYDLLRAVSTLDEETLQRELARLVEADLLHERGVPPHVTYVFKHALVQEAAYQSLLRSQRRRHHRRIVRVLTEQFPDVVEQQPELIAHHATEAGLALEAAEDWHRAARRAVERSAAAEAIAHCTKGIELLAGLPDSPERGARELALQVTLGLALQQTRGWSAPEFERAATRAHELCGTVRDTLRLGPALGGLFAFFSVRGKLREAHEIAVRYLAVAEADGDSGSVLYAHYALGLTGFYTADLGAARAHLTRALALYDAGRHRALAFEFGGDGGILARCFLAHVLWVLGHPGEAAETSREMLELARRLAHPFTLAWALTFGAWHCTLQREWAAAQDLAEQAIAVSLDEGFPYWAASSNIWRAVAIGHAGQVEEGIELLTNANLVYQAIGAELGLTSSLAFLAGLQLRAERAEDGLRTVADGLALVDTNAERVLEAELYRLRGELLLLGERADEPAAHEALRRALTLAREVGAGSFELRAATSWSRLLRRAGRTDEARALLARGLGGVRDAYDTADLREARALLAGLPAAGAR